MNPILSIILPVYNSADYISPCIDSILEQTFEDFELIILNDGSTDHSKEIIKSKKDSRIVYVENKLNRGLIKTLNRGLYLAKGEYVGRMDSDDICLPDRFKIQISYMAENKDTDILGTNILLFDDEQRRDVNTKDVIPKQEITVKQAEQHKVDLLQYNTLNHPTVVIRKRKLTVHKLYYDRKAVYAEDYKLWLDAVLNNLRIESVNLPLLCYRRHAGQISAMKAAERFRTFNSIRYQFGLHYFFDVIQGNPLLYLSFIDRKFTPEIPIREYRLLACRLLERNSVSQAFDRRKFQELVAGCLAFQENKSLSSRSDPPDLKTF